MINVSDPRFWELADAMNAAQVAFKAAAEEFAKYCLTNPSAPVQPSSNGNGEGHIKRAYKKRAGTATAETVEKKARGLFGNDTGPTLLRMLASGPKTFVDFSRKFPNLGAAALHYAGSTSSTAPATTATN